MPTQHIIYPNPLITISGITVPVTVNQGLPNTLPNAWPVIPTDGTHSQSYTAAGEAKVIVDNFPATQPISGTVTVLQGTNPWVDNISQFGGNNVVTGTGISGLGIPRVTISNDSNILVTQSGSWTVTAVQATGANLHVVVDSGNIVVSGTVTAIQPTGTNLHVVVDSGNIAVTGTVTANAGTGNFTVVQPTGTNLHVVVDSGTIAATQSGTWNINNISGTISLPTGASTAANQATANTSLASIDSKLTAPLSVTQTEAKNAWLSFGRVATAATTTVPVMETGFTYTGTNVSAFIASGSANDTLAGTGAQKIKITYFKADGSGPFTETDNMQGTTGFFSTNTMAFIERAEVVQVGSGGVNAGAINIANLAPLSTMANIAVGENETYYAHHFVPLGKTGYITGFNYGSTATAAGQGGIFSMKRQLIPLATNPKLSVAGDLSLVGTSSEENIKFMTPIVVVGPAIITTNVTPDSATANTFNAFIEGYEQ